jgi:chloride channel protein, CIC family
MLTESPQPNVGREATSGLHLKFWSLVPLVGIAAGLGAGLLMRLLRAVQRLGWPVYRDNFLAAVQATSWEHRILIVFAAGILVAAMRWVLREATGGHSAELVEAIWFHAGRMPVGRTLARAILSIVVVGLGASVGREAAPKQTGAVVASALARRAQLPPGHRRLLVAFGAGAGMAAVYNIPFGGALFALEVLLGTLSLPLVAPALATSLIATAVAWLLLPDRPTYDLPHYSVSTSLVLWSILAGPLAGLAAVAYVRLISWVDTLKPKSLWGLASAPLAVFAVLGLTSVALPQLLGNGKDVVQLAFTGALTVGVLLLVTVLKPLATAACIGSGTPGGLFTPTLTFGAVLGALGGRAWSLTGVTDPNGAFAVIGATAVLAASTQGPASAIVMVLELTGHLDTLMVPTMLAVAEAIIVARLFESRSVYSGRIHTGEAAARQTHEHEQVPRISSAARYFELMRALIRMGREPQRLKVLDECGELLGEISPERIRSPDPALRPLEIATARDFIDAPEPSAPGERR